MLYSTSLSVIYSSLDIKSSLVDRLKARTLKFETLWRRKWQPTPVLLPGKSRGRRSLVDCSPWGRKESALSLVQRLRSL